MTNTADSRLLLATSKPPRGIALALMILMAMAAFMAVWLKPTKKLAQDAGFIDIAVAVPKQFGQWTIDTSMTPIAPSPDQTEALAATYDQIVGYTYVNAKRQQVMLSMAYGSSQKQGLRAHRQEVCYRAQGFNISEMKQVDFQVLGKPVEAAQFVARYGKRVEPVTYWFTMGDHVVRSYLGRQIVQMQYALSGYIPDGYLFRVSTLGTETAAGHELQRQFTEELMQHLPPDLKVRLLGAQ